MKVAAAQPVAGLLAELYGQERPESVGLDALPALLFVDGEWVKGWVSVTASGFECVNAEGDVLKVSVLRIGVD